MSFTMAPLLAVTCVVAFAAEPDLESAQVSERIAAMEKMRERQDLKRVERYFLKESLVHHFLDETDDEALKKASQVYKELANEEITVPIKKLGEWLELMASNQLWSIQRSQQTYLQIRKRAGLSATFAQSLGAGPKGIHNPLGGGETDAGRPNFAKAEKGSLLGYRFKLLKAQGKSASGGEMEYGENGELTRGFAYVAYPVKYDYCKSRTFMISSNGGLYAKDLGPESKSIAEALTKYDPDKSWELISETPPRPKEERVPDPFENP